MSKTIVITGVTGSQVRISSGELATKRVTM